MASLASFAALAPTLSLDGSVQAGGSDGQAGGRSLPPLSRPALDVPPAAGPQPASYLLFVTDEGP